MNLKEAFRFQNKLNRLLAETQSFLRCSSNVTEVKTTYLCKKVMPQAENEVVTSEYYSQFSHHIGGVMDFALFLLEQKQILSKAISAAKTALPIDMDSETAMNNARQQLAETFADLVALRSSESLVSGGGTAYRFNAEGNQVAYRCDIRKVTTINYDRNTARKYLTQLNAQADAMSVELDRALINSQVDYSAPFDVNASFDEVLEGFLGL